MTLTLTHKHQLTGLILITGLILTLVWGNHFTNGFHFDDSHTIVDNPAIRDLSNIPRFFTDRGGKLFSVYPPNQTWRPVLSTTLAIDYWIGGGKLNPIVFQVDSFIWFLVLLAGIWRLCYRYVWPFGLVQSWGIMIVFAIHPITTETVNYSIQRGEIIAGAALVWALILLLGYRHWTWVLVYTLGMLAKPIILILPVMVLLICGKILIKQYVTACKLAITCLLPVCLVAYMNPQFTGQAGSKLQYILTQPWVWAYSMGQFILPVGLSADPVMAYVSWQSMEMVVGLLIILAVGLAIYQYFGYWTYSLRNSDVHLGLAWFGITMLPTSLMPITEVFNYHRLFIPLIGLCIAFMGTYFWAYEYSPKIVVISLTIICFGFMANTYYRNQIWASDTALWREVITKNPTNCRAKMNYGLTFMAQGGGPNLSIAKWYFDLAEKDCPAYWVLEVNRGILADVMGDRQTGNRYWRKAMGLAPELAEPWLKSKRNGELE